jgi:hypothetical protein
MNSASRLVAVERLDFASFVDRRTTLWSVGHSAFRPIARQSASLLTRPTTPTVCADGSSVEDQTGIPAPARGAHPPIAPP